MKNFLTFLVIAVVIVIIIVLVKKPSNDGMDGDNSGAAGIMLEGSDPADYDNDMVGGDAAVDVEIGGQGDTTAQ